MLFYTPLGGIFEPFLNWDTIYLTAISPGGVYRSVSGVAGFSVPLTCDITPRLSEDQLLLILWYKIGLPSPVYT